MEENYLKKVIKKSGVNTLVIIIACIGIFAFGFFSFKDKVSTLFTTLETGTNVESIQKLYENKKAYIQLKDADIYFLDYAIYTYNTVNGVKTGEEKLDQVYGMIAYEDGYLLALLPKEYLDMTDEELSSVNTVALLEGIENGDFSDTDDYHKDAYDELINTISESYGEEASFVKDYVPEICITITDNGRTNDQMIFGGITILFLVALGILIRNILVKNNYKSSKFYKSLNRIGNAESIEHALEQSIVKGTYLYKSDEKSYAYAGLITPEYVLAKNNTALTLASTKDMIWAHLKVTKHKYYFITTGKSFQVVMYFKNNKTPVTIDFKKEDEATSVIQTLAEKLSVIAGYSDELMKMFKKDYQGFLRMAEEQKESASGETEATNETYE
ncbi:hypothetical protein [Clostridium sp. KNHs205]|jgi:hypothetical protein|uniref:DUF6709 family protein n=1 Tax=Clostridium sp. KNHs205 TaxID=1449050 RepID=UPI00051B6FE4|nr:hypothetical protein [Clostridium sp. KNHs205]